MDFTSLESFITFAYGLIPFAALYGYAPMIWGYWKQLRDGTPEDCTTQAYGWLMWGVCNGISMIYSFLINGDLKFVAVSSANFALSTTTCILAFLVVRGYKRVYGFLHDDSPLQLRPQPIKQEEAL